MALFGEVKRMRVVTPKEFSFAFLSATRKESRAISEQWNSALPGFTAVMEGAVFPGIAQELGLMGHAEYRGIDGVLFEDRDNTHFRKNQTYAKRVAVVFEHENKPGCSFEEMNKLTLFNVPLKVLVTYATDGSNTDYLLRRYEAIIQAADWFKDVATTRRQLVILGEAVNTWRFYVYKSAGDSGRFERYDPEAKQ
jgi:hypothetical protein